jgi:transposase
LDRLVASNSIAAASSATSYRQIHDALREQGFEGSYRVVVYQAHRIQRKLLAERFPDVWTRAKNLSDGDSAKLLRSLVSGRTRTVVDADALDAWFSKLGDAHATSKVEPAVVWSLWFASLVFPDASGITEPVGGEIHRAQLLSALRGAAATARKRAFCVLAHLDGFSTLEIAKRTGISPTTVRKYRIDFKAVGCQQLFARKLRARQSENADLKAAVFSVLHEPPHLFGINRTTWRLEDVRSVLAARGTSAGEGSIREVIRAAGFRWRSAKVVLTSTDPNYREKLANIQDILSRLGSSERFFSIDEFGPFAVKMKGGRALSPPGAQPTVPQWQKSKGRLILTAALELSTNQVTHFYSEAKNTAEMIRMAKVLIEGYREATKLYLSWDAASWHLSKKLTTFVEDHNASSALRGEPTIELAPLPASAQFLNVIESVFSGMARSIIHRSNYDSKDAAKAAIDGYFTERNAHFLAHPRRAGRKIWGKELVTPNFSASNNCKDPSWR